jgi:hypothetical protein
MLPEGEYVYKDLSSDFVDVDKLIDEIREEGVSGYLSFESESGGERGFAELDQGEPGRVKSITNGEERITDGPGALAEILEEGGYTVQVVDCGESGQEIVDIKLKNEEVKSGISTEEVDVPQFLSTNITDQKNDCHVILISEGYSGVITMVDGVPEQAKVSTPTEIFVGNDALNKALEYIEEGKVSIDVYMMTDEEVKEKEEAEEAIGERMKGELEGISEEFEEKADDLLADMGLDFMAEEGMDGEGADSEEVLGAGGGGGTEDDGDETEGVFDEVGTGEE